MGQVSLLIQIRNHFDATTKLTKKRRAVNVMVVEIAIVIVIVVEIVIVIVMMIKK